MKIGIELAGIPGSDRGRGEYLAHELRLLGHDARNVSKDDPVDIRIMRTRDFSRQRKENEIIIFDVSDAIMTPPLSNGIFKRIYQKIVVNKRIKSFISQCDAIVVGSRIQCEIMSKYNEKVFVVPDVSYYHRLYGKSCKTNTLDKIVFVWDGQGHNFIFLEKIIKNNIEFFQRSDVQLKVITDRCDNSRHIDNQKKLNSYSINSTFVEWSLRGFVQEVNSAHVGLAPVNLNCHFALAKPDNKMVNYQGLGMPAIASNTVAYADYASNSNSGVIVCGSDDEWKQALEFWRVNRNNALKIGLLGRQYVLENYLPNVLAKKWQQVIIDLTHAI